MNYQQKMQREKVLLAQANRLMESNGFQAAKPYFDQACAIRTAARKDDEWSDRYSFACFCDFEPILEDGENDLAVSSMTIAHWELLKNGSTVRTIRGIRFGVIVLSDDDRIPEIVKPGVWTEIFNAMVYDVAMTTRKRKALDKALATFDRRVSEYAHDQHSVEDHSYITFGKVWKVDTPYGSLDLPTNFIPGNERGAARVDIEALSKNTPPPEKATENLLRAVRACLFYPHGQSIRYVGRVTDGGKRRK